LVNKGIALYDLGRYHDAIILYDKVLSLNPNDAYTINNKANALGKLGKSLEAIGLYQRAIKLIQSNQTSRVAFTPAKSTYMFVSENDVSNIQLLQIADSGNNGQNQTIITLQMNLAQAYTTTKPPNYHLAIATYSGIINDDPYNGCALLGRADAYKKSGQLDLATRDENVVSNILKQPCHTGGINLQKPAQPSQPEPIGFVAKGMFS
jgi:tetratricopeptide (TPR) repeat protein